MSRGLFKQFKFCNTTHTHLTNTSLQHIISITQRSFALSVHLSCEGSTLMWPPRLIEEMTVICYPRFPVNPDISTEHMRHKNPQTCGQFFPRSAGARRKCGENYKLVRQYMPRILAWCPCYKAKYDSGS